MKKSDVDKLSLGVYRFHWKGVNAGTSVGVVGQDHNGNLWIACSNWTYSVGNPVQSIDHWDKIKKIELITKD